MNSYKYYILILLYVYFYIYINISVKFLIYIFFNCQKDRIVKVLYNDIINDYV